MLTNRQPAPLAVIEEFSSLLEEKTGLYFPRERCRELENKLLPLMNSAGIEDSTTGFAWLKKHLNQNQHVSDLAYHLTIGETYFFRDARLFSILENHLLPELIERHRKDKSLRIWSAGCCTGEEPYSIAILLHRLLPDIQEWNIHFLATDLNPKFLNKAIEGRYTKWSFRTMPKRIVDTYFDRVERDVMQLCPEIRQMVTFATHNLVEDTLANHNIESNYMDLILCNNVLIYFSQSQINKTINHLTSALADKGWLAVTPIEAPFIQHPEITPHTIDSYIFFRKEVHRHPTQKKPAASPPIRHKPAEEVTKALPKSDDILLKVVLPAFLKSATPVLEYRFSPAAAKAEVVKPTPAAKGESPNTFASLCHQKKYEEAITKLLAILEPDKNNPVKLKEQMPHIQLLVRTLANQKSYAEAIEWCDRGLSADKLDPVLHYLHAEVLSGLGLKAEAIKALKRSIFTHPDFIAAHYLLGLLAKECQDHATAARQLNIVLELIAGHSGDEVLPGTEELTVAYVKDHIEHILRRP